MMRFTLIVVLGLILASCQNNQVAQAENPELGKISIDVTGNEDAIPLFEDGLLLLHSFEFKDAAEKFRAAQELDPSFAMAYWGEAMTCNHPLWREQERSEAQKILQKLGAKEEEQSEKFKTPFEKDLHKALCILYNGQGSKNDRDVAYSDYMATLHTKYPDNHEIASFYALSLLGAVKGGRDYEQYQKGARIAQSIIDENPSHPGALHYLIHSYDDPDNAPKALSAADSYAKVAPDASHALHMPSHIYVALGMWDEVVSSNQASWEASVKRKERKNLDNDALGYHSFKWLMYGHLQRGEYADAKALVKDMQKYCYEKPSSRAISHLIMMKGAYFSETDQWDDPLVQDTVDYSDLSVQMYGTHAFIQGMFAIRKGNMAELTEIITKLDDQIKAATNEVMIGNPAMCSGSYSRKRPTQTHIDRATVVKLELQALEALQNNNPAIAESLMIRAMDLEEQTTYMYGPPEIVKPSNELYAEWLVTQKRYKEAKVQFEKILERAPKRLIAIKGIEQTEKAMGV